jgi:hypothetical protein
MKEAIIRVWRKLQSDHTYAHSLVIISLVIAGLGLKVNSVALLAYLIPFLFPVKMSERSAQNQKRLLKQIIF